MRFWLSFALALCCGCAMSPDGSGGSSPVTGGRNAPPATLATSLAAASQFDAAILEHVNRQRTLNGRPALRADPRLARAARDHAANMAAFRSHSHRLPIPGQSRLAERMDRQGVRYRVAGENIGMEKVFQLAGRPISVSHEGCRFTYADTRTVAPPHDVSSLAEAAVARWMASPKHRSSILRADFRRTGSGFAIDPSGPACGDVYLAQTFSD